MNDDVEDGVFLLFCSGLLALLWFRGYLTPLMSSAIAALGGSPDAIKALPAKQGFNFAPSRETGGGTPPSNRQSSRI